MHQSYQRWQPPSELFSLSAYVPELVRVHRVCVVFFSSLFPARCAVLTSKTGAESAARLTTSDVSTSAGLLRPQWPFAAVCVVCNISVCARVCLCVFVVELLRPASISGIILSRMAAGLHGCCWHFSTMEAINWSLTLRLSVLSHEYICLCVRARVSAVQTKPCGVFFVFVLCFSCYPSSFLSLTSHSHSVKWVLKM